MTAADIAIRITAKDEAKAVLQEVKAAAVGVGKALGDVSKIASGFVLGQGLIAAPNIVSDLRNTAQQLELQMQKANVVFGDQIGVVKEWAAENAHAMGMTKREATNAAASFADLLIPMGFTREAAAKMSTDVVGLSGALSEWSGGTRSAAEVSRILAKAMLGERESLKELGISITEADVQARLLQKGQAELTGEMLAQAKAVATQELIFEKSKDAQTAFAQGAGTAARRQAEFSAAIKEWKETAALALAEGFLMMQGAAARALPAIEATVKFLADHKEILAGVAATILAAMVPAIVAWTAATWAHVVALTAQAVAFAAANAPLIALAAAIGLVAAGVVLAIKHWDEIKPVMIEVAEVVRGNVLKAWRELVDFVDEHLHFLLTIVKAVFEDIRLQVQLAMNVVMGIVRIVMALVRGDWEAAWHALKQLATDVLDGVRAIVAHRLQAVRDIFIAAMGGVLDVVRFIGAAIINWFQAFPGMILGALGNLSHLLFGVGRDILAGLWNGMKEKWEDVRDWLGGIGGKIKDAIGGALGVFSPSRVMMVLGKDITAGLQIGMQQGAQGLLTSLGNTVAQIRTKIAEAQAPASVSVNFQREVTNGQRNNHIIGPLRIRDADEMRTRGDQQRDSGRTERAITQVFHIDTVVLTGDPQAALASMGIV